MNNLSWEESRLSYYGWVVVGVIFLAQLSTFGLVYSFGVFFKPLASEFHWSRAVTAGAFSAYAIIHDILAPVAGRITDRFGPKLVTALGGFYVGLAMLLMSQVNAIWHIYIFYGLIFSLGAASIYAPLMATVSQWFTEKRGIAVGITTAGIGAGSLVFSPLAAWLVSSYGWRMAYIVAGAICWVLFIPIVRFIRRAPKRNIEVEHNEESTDDFTAAEALKTKAFWMLSLAWFFDAMVWGAIMVNIVPLITDRGVPLMTAGIIAGVIGGMSIAGRVSGGLLSDKIGRGRWLLISFALKLLALILFLCCQELWMFFLFAVIFGFGLGGVAGVMPSFPADLFGLKATATILGFAVLLAGMGVALGSFTGGRIFDVTGSYHNMIWMCIFASIMPIIFTSLTSAPKQ